MLALFEQVRIINLVDRLDRRREMMAQLARVGGMAPNIAFFAAQRPADPGDFPNLGTRGCYESHLAILREARDAGAGSLLVLEDDLNFVSDIAMRGPAVLGALGATEWDFFYGAHVFPARPGEGLLPLAPGEETITASFLGFSGRVIAPLVDFLEAILTRPAGSPDYGPMHVDGAYAIFQNAHPEYRRFAAFPPLGRQRSSRSDITPRGALLDRFAPTRNVAGLIRRVRNAFG